MLKVAGLTNIVRTLAAADGGEDIFIVGTTGSGHREVAEELASLGLNPVLVRADCDNLPTDASGVGVLLPVGSTKTAEKWECPGHTICTCVRLRRTERGW
jgi:hypothetical protein